MYKVEREGGGASHGYGQGHNRDRGIPGDTPCFCLPVSMLTLFIVLTILRHTLRMATLVLSCSSDSVRASNCETGGGGG